MYIKYVHIYISVFVSHLISVNYNSKTLNIIYNNANIGYIIYRIYNIKIIY